ncbi:uncharacterized protein BP5553_03999 [Venustampulla echinocandica]|uniref:DNA 3'-5' helicase n=1 Tax=Venustampulla echinocandica TaxID=2656787 RepID=A0A370TVW7_9HELO|nr:uncharacterized protein BP5553_03999 [Venustampulla echinocandica]RDL39659.1 hypothetical protein BP5553_03999 [Venustampulla echinocandica]
MDRGINPDLQRFLDSAQGLQGQDQRGMAFSFQAPEPQSAGWRFGPAPRHPAPGQSSFNGPVVGSRFNPPHQPVPPQSTHTERISLGPRNLSSRLDTESRTINNHNDHFKFTQNLRQDMPFGQGPLLRPSNAPPVDRLDQLVGSMLMQSQIARSDYEPEPITFSRQSQAYTSNPLQPQKQQVTPPFNLSDFAYSPEAQQPSTSSSPFGQYSSPTTRVSLRRTANRAATVARPPVVQNSLDEQLAEPRTPQNQTTAPVKRTPHTSLLEHAPPMAHGIQLISPHELPDRFRQIFPYELFNAVQSKCFAHIYKTNDNVVVAAPTGSGKTALLELAICRAVEGNSSGQFKIVYQAPTKSLCSERFRDWNKKFSHLNLPCAELTGDTSQAEMARVRAASIIVTTPEKWDSITRKWADHHKLVQMVKLFLIDEVHILKEVRGATLEAVVSRMKSIGANVRFVALSATIPNSEDIAVWLGRDHTNQQLPAHRQTFGENFRPVKLQKHVYGFESNMNDFAFEKHLDGKLPSLIEKHTQKKPIMVFCFTRKSCETTATMLADWWTRKTATDRAWPAPRQQIVVGSKELQDLIACGVAFHHAGLAPHDRQAVESGFLKGDISLICCTSTLAVGVNLPCHLVVLKGTIGYQTGLATEYCDLEVMQMLGRAGRPQFEDSAVAVIMTKSENKQRYELMISGQDILESSLHLHLIEHLNSEISLRTVNSLETAKFWLEGTFLAVRMRQNPGYYKIDGILPSGDIDQRLKLVCERDIKLLQEHDLVTCEHQIKCTEYGEAMSRYMVQFVTMKLLLSIPKHANTEQILSIMCQAAEFKDVRMKPNQRACLREFNKSPFLKYPIKENISTTAHKISLLVQVQLGGVEHPNEKGFAVLKRQFTTEKNIIFDRIQRLIRCVIDCKAVDCDAISTRHALGLARSLAAGFWENSNLQLRQIPQFGPVTVKKLISNNINSIEKLASLDTASIERILSKNPPFGKNTLQLLVGFPRLSLTSEVTGRTATKSGGKPSVNVKIQLRYANAKVPVWDGKKPSLTFTAETSDGVLAHFWRGRMQQLEECCELKFTVELSGPDIEIKCYIACDSIVGTVQSSMLEPNIPPSEFPVQTRAEESHTQRKNSRRSSYGKGSSKGDEFGGDDIDDDEMLAAVTSIEKVAMDDFDGFVDIDDDSDVSPRPSDPTKSTTLQVFKSVQMPNGKWTCKHACHAANLLKNGKPCRHRCCHEGIDKPPRAKTKDSKASGSNSKGIKERSNPSKLRLKKAGFQDLDLDDMEVIDLSSEVSPTPSPELAPREYRRLHKPHTGIQEDEALRLPKQKPQFQYASSQSAQLPPVSRTENRDDSLESISISDDSFPSPSALLRGGSKSPDPFEMGDLYNQNDHPSSSFQDGSLESLEAGMIGLSDSMMLRGPTPTLTSSFADRAFDFKAFEVDDDGQKEQSSSEPNELLTQHECLGVSDNLILKRQHSPTPDLEIVKHRRVRRDERAQHTPQGSSIPAWVDEFDADLIDGLKDFVDFVD